MITPARYRHRTVEIEAVQWTGRNAETLRALCSPFDFEEINPEDRTEDPDETAAVRTHAHGGWLGLKPGFWVLKEADRFTVASDEEFRSEWEPVDQTTLRGRIAAALMRRVAAETETDDTNLTETDVDRMLAEGVPVQIVSDPPATHGAAPADANTPTTEGDALVHATPVAHHTAYGLVTHSDPIDIGWINGSLDAQLRLSVRPDMDEVERDQLLADLRAALAPVVPVRPRSPQEV